MAYERKTYDEWQLLSNYGYGWEVETRGTTRKEISQRIKEYRANASGDFRIKKVRIKKEDKDMTYGKNAKVGNLTVFSKNGAIEAYKIFCNIFNKEMTMEASSVMSDAFNDLIKLGFTPCEIEEIELSTL